jgi:dipeptidyl aminopeptidase/acylaminoacyl peptidase
MTYRDITLQADGINIEGRLYLPGRGERESCPAVCICHGIPSGIQRDSSDVGYPAFAERICNEGFAVFIFNFRGTGESGGNMDMTGWTRDLKAVIDYLTSLPVIEKNNLTLLGFSAGAAVSVCVASKDTRVSAVIACACSSAFNLDDPEPLIDRFRNIGVIRDETFPESVDKWRDDFNAVRPVDFVAEIAGREIFIVHGNRDDVVDVSQAYRLYAGAGEPKHLTIVDGGTHRLRQDERAMAIVIDWLKSRKSN